MFGGRTLSIHICACLYANSCVEKYLPFTHFSRTLSFVLLYPFTELWTCLFGKSAKLTWVFIASISSVILDESLYLWLFCYLDIELDSSLVYLGLHCFDLICHPRWIPVCLIVLLSRHRIGVFSCIPYIWCLRCIPCIHCIRCFHSTAPRSRTCDIISSFLHPHDSLLSFILTRVHTCWSLLRYVLIAIFQLIFSWFSQNKCLKSF